MKQNRKNNCLTILEFIKKHGSINRKQCEDSQGLNIPRLAARIWDLRHKMGQPIISTKYQGLNESYAIYTLGDS